MEKYFIVYDYVDKFQSHLQSWVSGSNAMKVYKSLNLNAGIFIFKRTSVVASHKTCLKCLRRALSILRYIERDYRVQTNVDNIGAATVTT